jgi:hypothetical protein
VKPAPAPVAAPAGGCTASITTTPPDSQVRWGALDLGTAPLDAVAVPCGAADVTITHPRYANVARSETATAGATTTLEVKLQRPPAVLTLRSIPPGATMVVDRATVGRAPVTAKVMGFETLHVTATLPGYAPWHGTIKVRGATGSLFARLTRAK